MERAELIALLRATGCAEERGEFFFLCDPRWGGVERKNAGEALRAASGAAGAELGWLGVPTGGTSGRVRFARHDERTLGAAARGFCGHFGLKRVNAVDVLPAFHVSGLMARVRCAATGGTHVAWDWKRIEAGETPPLGGEEWVISLVPTQLQRLLRDPRSVDWLQRFRIIFLGGGPVWRELADEAAAQRLQVALSYGMTETAAMVAAQRPEDFLAGDRSAGSALPHARITITDKGTIGVEGESMFRGYFPEWRESRRLETEDMGEIDDRGRLRVSGRRDEVIITGGEKVQPAEVEAALRSTGEFEDVAVVGVADAEWGERVVACYPRGARAPDFSRVETALRQLAAFKRPKRYVAIDAWPRNAQGKVNRSQLKAAAAG